MQSVQGRVIRRKFRQPNPCKQARSESQGNCQQRKSNNSTVENCPDTKRPVPVPRSKKLSRQRPVGQSLVSGRHRKPEGTMRRGTKCVAQTINLSNPETCIRPKKVQKLVHADVLQSCPTATTGGGSSYWTPRPVSIRICTRQDMQRTCPPKLCDCPQKGPPRTFGQKLCTAILFLLKSGIAVGLVYWTHSEGLWGSSADVEDLYRRIMATITSAGEQSGADIELPRISEYKYKMVQKYNQTVFTVMNCLANASSVLRKRIEAFIVDKEESAETEDPEKKTGGKKSDGRRS